MWDQVKRFLRHHQTKRILNEMGISKGVSIGVRMDGTIDVDLEEEGDGEEWGLHNLNLSAAKYLHEELGRAIARQIERGFDEHLPTDSESVKDKSEPLETHSPSPTP